MNYLDKIIKKTLPELAFHEYLKFKSISIYTERTLKSFTKNRVTQTERRYQSLLENTNKYTARQFRL